MYRIFWIFVLTLSFGIPMLSPAYALGSKAIGRTHVSLTIPEYIHVKPQIKNNGQSQYCITSNGASEYVLKLDHGTKNSSDLSVLQGKNNNAFDRNGRMSIDINGHDCATEAAMNLVSVDMSKLARLGDVNLTLEPE